MAIRTEFIGPDDSCAGLQSESVGGVPTFGDRPRLKFAVGRIDVTDVSSRVLFPTPQQAPLPPFERFGETLATSRKKPGMHAHADQEVVVYLLEGAVEHADESGGRVGMAEGSVLVLTAPSEIRHELTMRAGRSARWLGIVLGLTNLPEKPTSSILFGPAAPAREMPEGTIERIVLTSEGSPRSSTGLALHDIMFPEAGTRFLPVGHDREGVVYVLAGSGNMDSHRARPGEGAVLDGVAGVALTGEPGFRVILATAPRGTSRALDSP